MGNKQSHSRVGTGSWTGLSLGHARLSSIHLSRFTWCLLAAGPLFTSMGNGHRQYRAHIAHCDHI